MRYRGKWWKSSQETVFLAMWPWVSDCDLLGLSLILGKKRVLHDHWVLVQGCKDIMTHKLTSGCPLQGSSFPCTRKSVFAVFLVAAGTAKGSQGGVLVSAGSMVPAYYMGETIQPEKVTLIQPCRYIDLLHKNNWNRPVGDKHDQILANDKSLHCLDHVPNWNAKFRGI